MKQLQLLALALVAMAAAPVSAQLRSPAFGPRVNLPNNASPFGGHLGGGQFRRGHGLPAFIIVEREPVVIVEREVVVREVPVAPPAPPPPPRKPFVVGKSYASLPGGCMKMIEGGASYYYCGGGEWFLQTGKQYKAVRQP